MTARLQEAISTGELEGDAPLHSDGNDCSSHYSDGLCRGDAERVNPDGLPGKDESRCIDSIIQNLCDQRGNHLSRDSSD